MFIGCLEDRVWMMPNVGGQATPQAVAAGPTCYPRMGGNDTSDSSRPKLPADKSQTGRHYETSNTQQPRKRRLPAPCVFSKERVSAIACSARHAT